MLCDHSNLNSSLAMCGRRAYGACAYRCYHAVVISAWKPSAGPLVAVFFLGAPLSLLRSRSLVLPPCYAMATPSGHTQTPPPPTSGTFLSVSLLGRYTHARTSNSTLNLRGNSAGDSFLHSIRTLQISN